ncbi:MAG: type II secretion system protein [Verrucomicrobiaceae bacterium]|nr:type II secretion system protein [Verrucomicrobiaceae bacterium]
MTAPRAISTSNGLLHLTGRKPFGNFQFSVQGRSAFTLLEILAVMALLSLILGISVISISGVQDEDRLRRAASMIETTARENLLEGSRNAATGHHATSRLAPSAAPTLARSWKSAVWVKKPSASQNAARNGNSAPPASASPSKSVSPAPAAKSKWPSTPSPPAPSAKPSI